jgi:hypothetical protein
MGNELGGNTVSSTYTRLVQSVSGGYYDGAGNLLNLATDASLALYVLKPGDTMTGNLTINASLSVNGKITMPATTSLTNGVLYYGTVRMLHNYFDPSTAGNNLWIGHAGNFSMNHSGELTYQSCDNVGIGYNALVNNTTGYSNLAIGAAALFNNTSGPWNTALGTNALYKNTSGSWNAGFGTSTLYNNIAGSFNLALGRTTLGRISQGDYNVGLGFDCAVYLENGQDASVLSYGTYLGSNIRCVYAEQNAIVIGYNAQSLGSNSVVIGNDTITKTVLKGNVGIGITTPTTKLHIAGNTTTAYGQFDAGINFLQVARPTTVMDVSILDVSGNVDGTHHYVYSYVTPIGETKVHGTPKGPYVFNASTSGQASLTVPISTDYRVTARKIYRTLNTTYPYTLYYLGIINNNTTTSFIDNVSDGGLGTIFAWYRPDTTNAMMTVNGVGAFFTDDFLTSVGVGAGAAVKAGGGYINTFAGTGAGGKITTGSFNTALGYGTISNGTTNTANVAIGEMAGYDSRGDNNIIIGSYTRSGITGTVTGTSNTIVGHSAQYNSKGTGQNNNTMLGAYAGYVNNGGGNIFLGMQSGYFETGSNKLIIDNTARADASAQQQYALIYGQFDTNVPSNQILALGGTGKVGIGTIIPQYTLDVSGNINAKSYYADGSAGFTGDVSSGRTMRFKNGILVQVI